MARDLSIDVRRAVVTRLNAVGSRTRALVQGRAYGPAEPDSPVWPFVRVDFPVTLPDFDGCSDATRYTLRVHGFATGDDESNAGALGAAISADLDEFSVLLVADPEAYLKDIGWTGTQLMRDTAKPNGYHAAVSIDCRVAG
jgi:hypothetical protein